MIRFYLLCVIIGTFSLPLKSQILYGQIGYAVAHNNGNANVLYQFNGTTNEWTEIGLTGTNNIKAIATDAINNVIYAVDGGTFGEINAESGLFISIGAIGSTLAQNGTYNYEEINLDNIHGLTFDPINKVMYATHRVESGDLCGTVILNSNDFLFQIDILTGKLKPGAMQDYAGNPLDNVIMRDILDSTYKWSCTGGLTLPRALDINDIAYNIYTGELYAIQHYGYGGGFAIFNPVDAYGEAILLEYHGTDFIGLAFNATGELFGTTGINAVNSPVNGLKYINTESYLTVELPPIDPSGTNFDFRGIDYFTAYNDLALSITIDPEKPNPIIPNDDLAFLITVYNQGKIDNTNINIVNYIPEGLLLNDPNWEMLPGTNKAIYEFEGLLTPLGKVTIPINFSVDINFAAEEIVNTAEITASFNNNITDVNDKPLRLPDIDSWPDDRNKEHIYGSIVLEDEIDQAGPKANEDEDDHDIATINLNDIVENLSLLTTVTPASCNSFGAAEINIFDNSTPPYKHKWQNDLDTIVYLGTTNSATHQVTGLQPDIYNVRVYDASGRLSVFTVEIPLLASNSGNLNCNNNCPGCLITPNSLLYGVFQAEEELEILGFVDGSKDAEFRICE